MGRHDKMRHYSLLFALFSLAACSHTFEITFDSVDRDGNGLIDADEFETYASFAQYDHNGDGAVTMMELKAGPMETPAASFVEDVENQGWMKAAKEKFAKHKAALKAKVSEKTAKVKAHVATKVAAAKAHVTTHVAGGLNAAKEKISKGAAKATAVAKATATEKFSKAKAHIDTQGVAAKTAVAQHFAAAKAKGKEVAEKAKTAVKAKASQLHDTATQKEREAKSLAVAGAQSKLAADQAQVKADQLKVQNTKKAAAAAASLIEQLWDESEEYGDDEEDW